MSQSSEIYSYDYTRLYTIIIRRVKTTNTQLQSFLKKLNWFNLYAINVQQMNTRIIFYHQSASVSYHRWDNNVDDGESINIKYRLSTQINTCIF